MPAARASASTLDFILLLVPVFEKTAVRATSHRRVPNAAATLLATTRRHVEFSKRALTSTRSINITLRKTGNICQYLLTDDRVCARFRAQRKVLPYLRDC